MIEHIPELVQAGVDSFKIEGRNKTAYYAACVTGAYRAAIDAYRADPAQYVMPQFCRDEVDKVSHREYYTGFYFGSEENGQHYGDSQYIREFEVVGMPVSCDADGHAVFALKNRFFDGEELELLQPGKAPYVFRAHGAVNDDGEAHRAVQCCRRCGCISPSRSRVDGLIRYCSKKKEAGLPKSKPDWKNCCILHKNAAVFCTLHAG